MSTAIVQQSLCNTPSDAHISISVKGSKEKVAFFHFLLGRMDIDWPWASIEDRRFSDGVNLLCDACKGTKYTMASLSPAQLKIFGKQVSGMASLPGNLKVKVHMWKMGCGAV